MTKAELIEILQEYPDDMEVKYQMEFGLGVYFDLTKRDIVERDGFILIDTL